MKPTLKDLENKTFTQEEIENIVEKYSFNEKCLNLILHKYKLSEDAIRAIENKLDVNVITHIFPIIAETQTLSENFIENYPDVLQFTKVFEYQTLSEDFIRKILLNNVKNTTNETIISCFLSYQKASESFIEEFKDKLSVYDWRQIVQNNKIQLSEEFMIKFWHKIDWKTVIEYRQLSEKFIEDNKLFIDWYSVSKYQNLSEDFIRKYIDNLGRKFIALYQRFSHSFAVEMNMIDVIGNISSNIKMTPEEKKEVIDTLQIVKRLA